MALAIPTGLPVWVGGYHISADIREVMMKGTRDQKDFPSFAASAWMERYAGLQGAEFKVVGGWNAAGGTALDGSDEALYGRWTSADVPVSVGTASGAVSEPAYTILATEADYTFGGAAGEVVPVEASGWSSGNSPLVRGFVLNNSTVTATGTGTAVIMPAVSATQRLYCALHVGTCTGTSPQITVVIQSAPASDFASPTTRITFTAAGTNSAQWGTTAVGAITDTRYRVSYTVTGTTPSIPFFVVLGIV